MVTALLLLILLFACPVHAQQLNPGGGIGSAFVGFFDYLMVGPVAGNPVEGTVNALQYNVNNVPLGVANMGDYAAGPWQPTLVGQTTPGTPTYTVQAGSFEKIGRQVTARFYVSIGNLGGMAGTVSIGNLPYPNNGTVNDFGTCSINLYTGITMTAGYTTVSGLLGLSASTATLYGIGPGMALTTLQATTNVAANAILVGTCNYHI